jgi:molybdopterin converting factor small subunit
MSSVVAVKVLFFAAARDAADGQTQVDISLTSSDGSPITTNTARACLIQQYPKLAKYIHEDIDAITMALNEEYVPHGIETPIKNGDVIAIIPPISGG